MLRDGLTLDSGIKHCRDVAVQARHGAFTRRENADAYEAAAKILEDRAKAERLNEARVADLEADNRHMAEHILELQKTIIEQNDLISRLKNI